ncbi:hypothetical protein GC175_17160 [bacterium]|nr:hypothetical protein [bacterium]
MTNQVKLKKLMAQLWQSACQDTPMRPSCQVVDGQFRLTISGNREQWTDLCQVNGVPSHAEQTIDGDTLTCTWESWADTIFQPGGLLSQHLENYEPRNAQLWMGRLVQRSIEMGLPALVEAGTGTGKTFAYAAVCMAMNKRVVVSVSNKALQMQLWQKDLPFLQKIFPGKKLALVQGKGNYVCRAKVEGDATSGQIHLEGELRDWYLSTQTGTVEEIPFETDWQTLAGITVGDDCTGKMCPLYTSCFYYQAKAERATADVLVCNHALLVLDRLYPGAQILPEPDVIIVDEAHQLEQYARNALGDEVTVRSLERLVDQAEKWTGDVKQTQEALHLLGSTLINALQGNTDSQVGIPGDEEFVTVQELGDRLRELADEIWTPGELPRDPQEVKAARLSDKVYSAGAKVHAWGLATRKGFVRWIDQSNARDTWGVDTGKLTMAAAPYDVAYFLGPLAGFHYSEEASDTLDHTYCRKCGRKLTADVVAVLEGVPYGPTCIRDVDPFGDHEKIALEDWLAADHSKDAPQHWHDATQPPVIFTSATLAAPDMEHFKRSVGVEFALEMQVPSPFDYAQNARLYVPNGASPDPHDSEFREHLVREIRELVLSSWGGAFLLFTSWADLEHCRETLEPLFTDMGLPVYVQGNGLGKMEIVKRMIEDKNAVLFATKSFFEGVSIDGQALRLVVVSKIPFEAPTPLSEAQAEHLRTYARETLGMQAKDAHWYPFNAQVVPKATLELKQAVGRLIRTGSDYGVMAILDPRLRTTRYGRSSILPSLPPAPLVAGAHEAKAFLRERQDKEMQTAKSREAERVRRENALFVEKDLARDEDGLLLWA